MNLQQAFGMVFTVVGSFIGLNVFLISATKETINIIFGNIFLVIIGYLTYLTVEIDKLKGRRMKNE